jgi:hypothetical protein
VRQTLSIPGIPNFDEYQGEPMSATKSIPPIIVCFWLIASGTSASATVDIVSLTVESTTSQSQEDVPVTFGQVFAPGDVADERTLAARLDDGKVLPLQIDAKARHGDGTLRHAVITTRLPVLPARSSSLIHLYVPGDGTGAVGPSVQLADLLATDFDAQIRVDIGGTTYSATARELIGAGSSSKWLDGPIVSEWHVSGAIRTANGTPHPHLSARFHIRSYAGQQAARVSVTLENSWSRVLDPGNFTYDVEVSVARQGIVLSQDNVVHYRQARWRRIFWWGAAPQTSISHDTSYMQRAAVVPTYDPSLTIPGYVLNEMESQWQGARTRLMSTGLIYGSMPDGGGRPDIAPLPRWTARYLLTQDERAKISMLGTGEQAGTFGIHFRDRDTDLPISLDTYPNITVLGDYGIFPSCSAGCSTPYEPDVSHQPSTSFVPYLVTGDFFHLEELQFWANWNLFYWGDHGGSLGLMVNDQIRAQAWGLRTLGHAAYITPDDHPLKAYFNAKLANNLSWYQSNIVDTPPTPLGYLPTPSSIGLENTFSTWMDDFLTWSLGHLANLGFSAAEPIFNYKAKFPVGRMTDSGYCWILASTYWTRSRNIDTGELFRSWSDYKVGVIRSWDSQSTGPSFAESAPNMSGAQEDALISAQCDSAEMASILGLRRGQMIGNAWSHEGYVANLQPAVAMAAERRVPGGTAAWERMNSRSVVPDSGDYDYNVSPQWAIVPGEIRSGNPEPPTPTPVVTISADPQSIAAGQSTTLRWTSQSADTCTASGAWSGARETVGSEIVGPLSKSATYTLQCDSTSGSASASVIVTVDEAPGTSPPSLAFSSSALTVAAGATVSLDWTASNATSCSASGSWSGSKNTSGSESVGPLSSAASFTLTCEGAGGSVSQTIDIKILPTNGDGASPPVGGAGAGDPPSLYLLLVILLGRSVRKHAKHPAPSGACQ